MKNRGQNPPRAPFSVRHPCLSKTVDVTVLAAYGTACAIGLVLIAYVITSQVVDGLARQLTPILIWGDSAHFY